MEDNKQTEATKLREAAQKKQTKINEQWAKFAKTLGREAYEDLIGYIDGQRDMFRKYAEERQMPHPNPQQGMVPLDNETVAALLQNSRGLNIVRTYIVNRVNTSDVAPTKN